MALLELGSTKYIKKVFEYADTNRKGYLTPDEYKIAIIAFFGNKPRKWEKDRIFESDKNRKISLKEFTYIVTQKVKFCEKEQHIREVFLQFDNDWKGFLVLEDLLKAQMNVLPHLNPFIAEMAFAEADLNKDGKVSYGEFHDVITPGITKVRRN